LEVGHEITITVRIVKVDLRVPHILLAGHHAS
jgi:hypothetical protein